MSKIELCDACLAKLKRAAARGGRAGDTEAKIRASRLGVEVRRQHATRLIFQGRELLVADWAKAVGVSKKTVYRKLKEGLDAQGIIRSMHGAEHLPAV